MKLRIAAFAAIMLAAILMMTGCSKATSNANGTNATNGNASAAKSPGPADAKPSSTAGSTTGSSSESTLGDAFREYYEAAKAKDVNGVKNLLSKGLLSKMEEEARASNKSVDDIIKGGLDQPDDEIPDTLPETRNEKIDGDKATIEIKDEKKDKWETLHFVKEDGRWKLDE